MTDHELQVAKNLNSAKCKNDDNNTQPVNNLHELDDGKNLNSVKCKNYDDNNGMSRVYYMYNKNHIIALVDYSAHALLPVSKYNMCSS